jgi:hypothetical protein
MTPSQKLIDAAAKVHYERLNSWGTDSGLKWTPWEELTQEIRERHYARVIGPVTVALRAAVEVCEAKVGGKSFANLISSLIPSQEPRT